MIDKFYVNKLANLKYPGVVKTWLLTEPALISLVKLFKRNLTHEDIIEIFEWNPKNDYYPSIHNQRKIVKSIIKNVYSDLNLRIDDDFLKRMWNCRDDNNSKDFIDLIHTIGNSKKIFSKEIKYSKVEDFLNSRSYKIYLITNE